MESPTFIGTQCFDEEKSNKNSGSMARGLMEGLYQLLVGPFGCSGSANTIMLYF